MNTRGKTALAVAGVAAVGAAVATLTPKHPSSPPPAPPVYKGAVRSVPDPALTPGDTLQVTVSTLAVRGYATTVRHVNEHEKQAVYARYGLDPRHHVPCEVDHLISLELGGSNDVTNLWPEPYDFQEGGKQVGALEKDKLEDRLHELVVAGKLDLSEAQKEIRTDWRVAYRKWLGEFPPYKPAAPPSAETEN